MYSPLLAKKTILIKHSSSVLVYYLNYLNCFILYKDVFPKIYCINFVFKL